MLDVRPLVREIGTASRQLDGATARPGAETTSGAVPGAARSARQGCCRVSPGTRQSIAIAHRGHGNDSRGRFSPEKHHVETKVSHGRRAGGRGGRPRLVGRAGRLTPSAGPRRRLRKPPPGPLTERVLPIPEPQTRRSPRSTPATPRPRRGSRSRRRPRRPNVLIVLIDDMGFGQSSAFGGPIHMPTLERLAKGGLRYNQFHTTALCSPTRAALLTGRNHHVCNMGSITETATAFPGQTGQRPEQRGPAGRDAAAQRLQHGRLRQVARDRRLGGQPLRPDRPLADPLRVRQVLRLHRRRDEPVGPGHLRGHEPRRAAEGPELPLHDRHDQPGDQVDAASRSR